MLPGRTEALSIAEAAYEEARIEYYYGYSSMTATSPKKNYRDFPNYFEVGLEELYRSMSQMGVNNNQFLREVYRRFGQSASESALVVQVSRTCSGLGTYCKTCDLVHQKNELDALGRCKNVLKQRKSVYAALFWNKYSSEGVLPFSASSHAH